MQEKDATIKDLKEEVNLLNNIKKAKKKYKEDKDYIADCLCYDIKKGQLTNVHNYMEHIICKFWIEYFCAWNMFFAKYIA